MKGNIGIFVTLWTFLSMASGGRILFLLPIATISETQLFTPLATELALKGHNITFVSPVFSDVNMTNFKEVIPIPPLEFSDFDKSSNPLEARRKSQNKLRWLMSFDYQFIADRCHVIYKNPDFQQILNEQFDLLVISAFFNQCVEGMAHRFQAPFIFLSSMPVMPGSIVDMTGVHLPPAFVPTSMLGFTESMNFIQRVVNSLMNWMSAVLYRINLNEKTEIYRHYLGQDYPHLREIEKNATLILSNSHYSINPTRLILPDIVEIGGLHCRKAQPLPKELDDWLSDSKEGFILFNLGSVIKGVTLPDETRKMFLTVFGKLKQKVLWKWETEEMPDLPPNVRLGKWLPQQDLLGHKNIRAFISHGGLLSTQEAIYHGVPIIGVPFFADQDVNMIQTEKLGISIRLEILELTAEKLENAIQEILSNPKYTMNAKKVSNIFRDRQNGPLQSAVYWTEYILRHRGLEHMRSPARNINIFQYYSLDVIAFLSFIFLGMLLLIVLMFKMCCCRRTSNMYEIPMIKKHN